MLSAPRRAQSKASADARAQAQAQAQVLMNKAAGKPQDAESAESATDAESRRQAYISSLPVVPESTIQEATEAIKQALLSYLKKREDIPDQQIESALYELVLAVMNGNCQSFNTAIKATAGNKTVNVTFSPDTQWDPRRGAAQKPGSRRASKVNWGKKSARGQKKRGEAVDFVIILNGRNLTDEGLVPSNVRSGVQRGSLNEKHRKIVIIIEVKDSHNQTPGARGKANAQLMLRPNQMTEDQIPVGPDGFLPVVLVSIIGEDVKFSLAHYLKSKTKTWEFTGFEDDEDAEGTKRTAWKYDLSSDMAPWIRLLAGFLAPYGLNGESVIREMTVPKDEGIVSALQELADLFGGGVSSVNDALTTLGGSGEGLKLERLLLKEIQSQVARIELSCDRLHHVLARELKHKVAEEKLVEELKRMHIILDDEE